jgi:hypothetical protein
LSSGGEFLALVNFDGITLLDSITFGSQSTDISYGRVSDGSSDWNFLSPSPGNSNNQSIMEITLPHNEGWNLVGLPLDTTPFPCNGYIDGSLYSFETGSYLNISTDEMAIGSGYWLRFEEEDECTFSGVPIDNITVSLNEGWNLISGISTSVAITPLLI